MNLLDLFSGIGGFSLGLERAGFRTVAFCEVAPACRHLLAHHWPGVPCYDDVRTLTAERLAADGLRVDAICGGFPCQDISFAGAGAGIEGERSGLWREYARLVGELRPRIVFVENVAALLGRGLGVVLGDLAALGYDAWWDCIPAAAVGAHHRRDRLWLVAYPRGEQHEGAGDALRRAVAAGLSGRGLADTAGERCPQAWQLRRHQPSERAGGSEPAVADASITRLEGWCQVRDADRAWQEPRQHALRRRGTARTQWLSEPDVGRVAHGVPARVDRLHGLGNAVVPQIPEILGRAALAALSNQGRAAA